MPDDSISLRRTLERLIDTFSQIEDEAAVAVSSRPEFWKDLDRMWLELRSAHRAFKRWRADAALALGQRAGELPVVHEFTMFGNHDQVRPEAAWSLDRLEESRQHLCEACRSRVAWAYEALSILSEAIGQYAASGSASRERPRGGRPRRGELTTDDLIIRKLQQNGDSHGWSASRWAREINRSKSSVVESKTYKSLLLHRLEARAERRGDRRRRTSGKKPSD